MPAWNPLLDPPAFPATGYAELADRMGKLLNTRNDIVLIQGEAIIALEAVATSIGQPGAPALNIVTSLYGGWFGDWLRRAGSPTTDLVAEPGLPIEINAVKAALDARPETRLLALVHAESASGILNPLPEIAALAKARGIVLIVDAVASFGGHELEIDGWNVDLCVTGPQKSVGGSSGLSVVSVSPAAWALIDRPDARLASSLSLLDQKRLWLDKGRGVLPGMPSALEFHALQAALDRVEAEGFASVIARHARAGRASRTAVQAMGLRPWVDEARASNLVTAAPLPPGLAMDAVLAALEPFGTGIAPGVGPSADRLLRLNHTGPRARFDVVLANVLALGQALRALGFNADLGAAAAAVTKAYAA